MRHNFPDDMFPHFRRAVMLYNPQVGIHAANKLVFQFRRRSSFFNQAVVLMNRLIKIRFRPIGNVNAIWLDHRAKEFNPFCIMLQIDFPGMQLQHQVCHQVFPGCRDYRFQITLIGMHHHDIVHVPAIMGAFQHTATAMPCRFKVVSSRFQVGFMEP